MILDSLNHHRVLFSGASDLHTPGTTDTGMWNIAIASNLVGGINHHYTLVGLIGQHASNLAQQGSFSYTWATENQDGLTLFDDITDQGNTAKYRATNTAR